MTVIYAADKDSLALLPELLCALKVDESKLPSDGKYKEFKANTAMLVSDEANHLFLKLVSATVHYIFHKK